MTELKNEHEAERQALAMQVASWIMRARINNEYVPVAQLVKEFTDDVQRMAASV